MMSSFFNELKNRNVYKAATAYVVSGWLVLQVVDILSNNLEWPNSVGYWVTMILAVGFPIVLLLTWLYELTPQGFKRTGAVQEDTPENRKSGKRLNHIIIGVLAFAICLMLVERVFFAGSTAINKRQQASIAVLPFANMSQEEENGLLANGLAAQIIQELQQISGMQVPARTSSFMYQEKNENVKQIAKELDVNYLLEGSIQYVGRGSRIRIAASLINASTGYSLWSDTFEEAGTDLQAIQEEVSRKVVSELRVQLLPEEDRALASRATQDKEAYRLFLKAKGYTSRGMVTSDDFEMAVELLNKAVELDPEFAEAHAELTKVYSNQFFFANLPKDERDAGIEYHLEKALEFGPDKPETILANARYRLGKNPQDSSQVIADLKKVVGMNPNYAEAHWLLGGVLGWARQFEAGLRHREKAMELDPFNNSYAEGLASTYFYSANDPDKAFALLDRIIAKDSSSNAARYKGRILAEVPYGDQVSSYILIHESGKNVPNELFNLNYHLLSSLGLDLWPVAEKYGRLMQMGYPDNEAHTFDNLSALYEFKGEYNKWIELVDFWSAEKGLDPKIEAENRTYIQLGLGNIKKARGIYEAAFPHVTKPDITADSIEYWKNYSNLVDYTEILRMDGDNKKADQLASELCEFYRSKPKNNPRAPQEIKNQIELDCYYLSNDTTAFVNAMEEQYFNQKDRLDTYRHIKQHLYRRFEGHPDVQALFDRITAETHRQRAEVIAYLKKKGDWDDAWDEELGPE